MKESRFDDLSSRGEKEMLCHLLCDEYELPFLEDGIETVPPSHRIVMAVEKFYGEVFNGGLLQYLTNGNGAFAIYAVPALKEMGLDLPASVLENAINLFPDEARADRDPDYLDCLDDLEEIHGEEILEKIEQPFWDWYHQQPKQIIRDSLHKWILAHRESLTEKT